MVFINSAAVYFKSAPSIQFPLLPLKYRLSSPLTWSFEVSLLSHVFWSNLPYATTLPQTHIDICRAIRVVLLNNPLPKNL